MFISLKHVLTLFTFATLGQSLVVPETPESRQTGKNLVILPLGDSITFGLGSSDGNSYRNALRTTLVNKGNTIDYIGSVKSGNMADNDNEGHSGFTIDQIRSNSGAISSLAQKPKVVLLHIGTNDANLNTDMTNAPNRLGALIDQIFTAAPDTTLLVAQIIVLNNPTVQQRINTYNNAIPGVVATRRNQGKIAVVNLGNTLTTADLADGVHPNAGGYTKMATVWAAGLQQAADAGWID